MTELVRVHPYSRSRFSGSCNCHCGRGVESVLHPHHFRRALVNRRRCVCGLRRWARIHWPRLFDGQADA